jgi:BirA family biotin operon repressor/biotin-[acetyl-CoA-carboxylase] ligase
MCAGTGADAVVVPGPPGTRFSVHRFAEIDSTNRYLLEQAAAGAAEGTVAVAAYQRAGRGRLGRRWEAPPGANLLVSVLLRPGLEPDDLHLCTVAVALAAADACARVAGVAPELKWPNDLVVGERKLAGILAETVPGARPVAVVVGLGLNVRWPGPGEPEGGEPEGGETGEVLRISTSLARQTGAAFDPGALLDAVLVALEPRLVELASPGGRAALSAEYRRRCATLGRTVTVTGHHETFTGVATDVTPSGHLVVELGTGRRTVVAGDVVHVRPPG